MCCLLVRDTDNLKQESACRKNTSWSMFLYCFRYVGGGIAGEPPQVAKASVQSKEHLAKVKQALRALGFNKQVLTYVTDSLWPNLLCVLTPSRVRISSKFSEAVVALRKMCMLSFCCVQVAVCVDSEVFNCLHNTIQDLTHEQAANKLVQKVKPSQAHRVTHSMSF